MWSQAVADSAAEFPEPLLQEQAMDVLRCLTAGMQALLLESKGGLASAGASVR